MMDDNFVTGRNKKLGLSGRKSRDVGILSTSKLYSLHDRMFAFTPQVIRIKEILFFNFIVVELESEKCQYFLKNRKTYLSSF